MSDIPDIPVHEVARQPRAAGLPVAMKPPTGYPCRECPWRRASAPGFVGPLTASEWVALAHSDAAIACHLTIPDGFDDEDESFIDDITAGMTQCSGAAIYRGNICKSPRSIDVVALPADRETVFGFGEFEAHHSRSSH